MKSIPSWFWTCAALCAAGLARAGIGADAGAAPAPEMATPPGAGGLILKLALSLGAVIGLILVLQRVSRRWGGGFGRGAGGDRIQVLSTRAVGPRLSLAVVQVMGRTLLVGISPQGIRPVADLGSAAGAPVGEAVEAAPEEKLTVAAAQAPMATAVAAAPAEAPDFETELARRLDALHSRYPTVSETEAGYQGGRS